jgi:hypothetical protein
VCVCWRAGSAAYEGKADRVCERPDKSANDPQPTLARNGRSMRADECLFLVAKRSCRRRISIKAGLTSSIAIDQKVFLSNATNLGVGDDRYAVIGNFDHYPSVQ